MRISLPLLGRSSLAALLLSLTACGIEPPPGESDEDPGVDAGTATDAGTDAGTGNPRTDAGTGSGPGGTDAGTGNPGTDAGTGTGTGTTTSRPLSAFQDGVITFYDANGTGNCSFDATNDLDVAAIIKTEYQGSAVCGACAEIQGPTSTLRVRIVDSCPDCTTPGHLDLSRSAFAKLADPLLGRVKVKWRFVTCPVTGAMRYRFKEGSSQWWTGIQVRNHHKPIRKMEWLKGLTWVEIPRQDYNYFVQSSGLGLGAITIRTTSWDGEVVQEILPGVLDSRLVTGLRQFTPLP
ncbi:MAG TPA: expansin EXLX1 family cellulose-binding protein [Archangium sp.]|jgi:expansin (peptidoglycan-binding protein)|uniref:expansin EXLX1 family cellulose-binding protein n=1 Tax=Archangium sp. TaxID=1872627 RepID=UPI002EDAE3F3